MEGPDSNAYWHPLFLRGLPSLAYKMKRPPKEKNSAAAARNASGATATECPNFLVIAKIAPLPPAAPYTISNEGKIVPLTNPTAEKQDDSNSSVIDSLEGIHLMDWAAPQPLTTNPFDSNSPSSTESDPKASKPAAAPASDETEGDDNQKAKSTSNQGASAVASSAADSRERLSEIDLRYLANQNRLLLDYVVQNQGTEQHESPVPAAAASPASDIE
jgi:hypothetical protein